MNEPCLEMIHPGPTGRRSGLYLDERNFFRTLRESFGPAATIDYSALIKFSKARGGTVLAHAYTNAGHGSDASLDRIRRDGFRVVETCRLIPESHILSKDTTDVRISVEIMSAAAALSEVIFATGDRSFLPLIEWLAATGRHVIGIGPDGGTGRAFTRAVHEFHYASDIPGLVTPSPIERHDS